MILEAKNVTFAYRKGDPDIVQNFNLIVAKDERVGLSAPSGFGKTTICQLLSGYLQPQAGEILWGGTPLPRRGYCPVQMIWQHPEKVVNPRLKMKEVLAEGNEIPDRILKGLGIETPWLNRYPSELSGGEMQRFCIARALGEKTQFILADEISTMLDLITQSQIWNFLLAEVKSRNIGMVVVTHSDPLLDLVATRKVDLTAATAFSQEN